MNEDEKWMQIAIREANLAKNKGEVPVGAIIIQNNRIREIPCNTSSHFLTPRIVVVGTSGSDGTLPPKGV